MTRHHLREMIFGLEDSLITCLGTVTGMAAGGQERLVVLLSGVVVTIISIASMSAGSYLSSKSALGIQRPLQTEAGRFLFSLRSALTMAISYAIGGFLPILPYLFFPIPIALYLTPCFTALILFGVGAGSAYYTKASLWKSGLEMMMISLGAALIGYLIGQEFTLLFKTSL
jgi:VIT1/CCC1 family predicted Fe2+/Mn2+ transporter